MIDPEQVGRELAVALLTEAREMKTVAIFAGRFQPFHAGHYSIYNYLVDKFGRANVYIGTSDVTDSERSPFYFAEKKKIICTMFGIPQDKVAKVKNPFAPEEILKKFDPKITRYITAFSEKDAGRLGGKYFKPFNPTTSNQGYEDAGYFIVAPVFGTNVSGTQIRLVFGDPKTSRDEKKRLFTLMYGKFNSDIFDMITKKLVHEEIDLDEELLLEGGAAGHLAHPFEDMNLTFGDLKAMIDLGLSGNLNIEAPVTEKLDGQAISVSWKNGKAIFARNKGHIKNFGMNALDTNGIAQMFQGRGSLSDAFTFAARDLEAAISKLSQGQREKIFGEGKKFMNVEVIFPSTENTVPYGISMLVFHNTVEYNESGDPIKIGTDEGRILAGMIKQVNAHIQSAFSISGPNIVTLPKSQNFDALKSKYFSQLAPLESKFKLSDNDPIVKYHQAWWDDFITAKANKLGYAMTNKGVTGLIRRWGFKDTSYTISDIKADIVNPKFLEWVLDFDKSSSDDQFKQNIQPFERLFLNLGAQILTNAEGLLSINPGEAVRKLGNEVEAVANELRNSSDIKKVAKLKNELERLASIEAQIAPTEGIVFVYKGKLYKFTGAFASINQILGLLKY